VNVDAGQFEAITDQLAELAAKMERLEQCALANQILVDAGRESARRKLGLAPAANVRAADTPAPRHLRAVRGDS
jgi:hypothetical protein